MCMMKVEKLRKHYEKFLLDDVSFRLEEGYIMGFIGSNGAGKTTTLKSIMGMVHPDSGTVEVFRQDFRSNELELKQKIAFMLGPGDYYPTKKVSAITDTYRRFYTDWDEALYQSLLKRFDIDPQKKIKDLSQGMKIKYSLSLALSHRAKLIILDEPTSGLDPVARDDLLELFQEFVEQGDKSILFSTHITSDLEKCADYITYIEKGRIVESLTKDELMDKYRIISGTEAQLDGLKDQLVSWKKNSFGFQGLIETEKLGEVERESASVPGLDDIMIYHSKRGQANE